MHLVNRPESVTSSFIVGLHIRRSTEPSLLTHSFFFLQFLWITLIQLFSSSSFDIFPLLPHTFQCCCILSPVHVLQVQETPVGFKFRLRGAALTDPYFFQVSTHLSEPDPLGFLFQKVGNDPVWQSSWAHSCDHKMESSFPKSHYLFLPRVCRVRRCALFSIHRYLLLGLRFLAEFFFR